MAKANEDCQRVQSIPGLGYLTALSVYASVGDIHQFHRSRQLSALLGWSLDNIRVGIRRCCWGLVTRQWDVKDVIDSWRPSAIASCKK
ncbi:transposase [Coxiella burnetii]|uniref:transposase n=1 Tax=Coxiella burnetii TaxID=777 RepID=UPI003DA48209